MNHTTTKAMMLSTLMVTGLVWGVPERAYAHCDTLDGPVIADARTALQTNNVTLVLKWVKPEHQQEIRDVFQKAMVVRKGGQTSREVADRFFFETLVRIHRAGEGAPYTGLKPTGTVDAAVRLADEALRTGSAEKLIKILTRAVEKGLKTRFVLTMEKKKKMAQSVKAGRQYVAAYVNYTHFIEQLHALLKGAGHHHGSGQPHTQQQPPQRKAPVAAPTQPAQAR